MVRPVLAICLALSLTVALSCKQRETQASAALSGPAPVANESYQRMGLDDRAKLAQSELEFFQRHSKSSDRDIVMATKYLNDVIVLDLLDLGRKMAAKGVEEYAAMTVPVYDWGKDRRLKAVGTTAIAMPLAGVGYLSYANLASSVGIAIEQVMLADLAGIALLLAPYVVITAEVVVLGWEIAAIAGSYSSIAKLSKATKTEETYEKNVVAPKRALIEQNEAVKKKFVCLAKEYLAISKRNFKDHIPMSSVAFRYLNYADFETLSPFCE